MLDKLFDSYLKVFLIGTMVFFVPNQLAYLPQEQFFQYGAVGFLFLSFIVPAKRQMNNWYIGIVLLYMGLNALVIHPGGNAQHILMNSVFGSIVIKTVSERADLTFKSIGKLFTVFCILNIFQLTLQVMNIDPIFSMVNPQNQTVIDQTGFLNARFALASVAVLMLPFMYAASPKYILAALPLLWFGKSSVCLGAAALVLLYLLWMNHRKLFWTVGLPALIGASVYVFAYDLPTGQFEKRLPVWWKGIEVFKTTPWFGVGLGSWAKLGFTTIQGNGQPETWVQAHNDVLQFMFEAGIAGLIGVWVWARDLFRSVKNPVSVSAFIALILVSFFHFPFHIARLAGIGCFIIAVMEASRVPNQA
jgi:O-antigen ligase